MWDIILDLLEKVTDVIDFWPSKVPFRDSDSLFLRVLGYILYGFMILAFAISVLMLLAALF